MEKIYKANTLSAYNDSCPFYDKAKSLLEQGSYNATTVLDSGSLGSANLGVFVDSVDDANLIGVVAINKISLDGTPLSKTPEEKQAIKDAVKNKQLTCKIDGINTDGSLALTIVRQLAAAKVGATVEKATVSPAVAKAMAEAEAKGFAKDEVEQRIQYMLDNRFPESTMLHVISYWRSGYSESRPTDYIDPALAKHAQNGRNGVVARIVHKAMLGYMCLLRGPKSTGKDTCVNSIAWLLMLPKAETVITRQTDMMDIFGTQKTDNSASDALSKMDETVLAKANAVLASHKAPEDLTAAERGALITYAMFEKLSAQAASVHIIHEVKAIVECLTHGGIFLIDEFNMGDSNLYSGFINPLGDGSTRTFDVPGYGPVPINDHFVLMATQNDGYAGCEDQNEATMSRFKAFVLAQPESIDGILHAAVKGELKKKHLTCAEPAAKYFKAAVKFYDLCKHQVLGEGSSSFGGNSGVGISTDQCLNIRGIVSALTCVAEYGDATSLSEELEDCVINVCPQDERAPLMAALNNTVNC